MIAVCPNNTTHKRFSTTAHVMQDWEVDEYGNFEEVITDCVQVSSGPNKDNIWTCTTCGAEAIVED